MNNISRKGLELKAIFALVLPSLLLGVASNFSRNIFLVAFFTMFRSFWTIYHQTKHTVRHLGRKHNVKGFLAVSTLASIWFSLLASLVTLYSATHFWLKHSKTVISITPLTVLAALNTNELT